MAYDNREVEIKLKVSRDEAAAVVDRISELKAKPSERQIDIYFDTPNRSFSSVRPIEVWLSCRSRGGRSHLNYKKFTYADSGATTDCKEIDAVTSDTDSVQELLKELGYEQLIVVDKTRNEGLVDDVLVAVDDVDGLGYFVELEATVAHGDFSQTRDYLLSLAHRLGINTHEIDQKGYPYHLLEILE